MHEVLLVVVLGLGIGFLELLLWIAACEVWRRMRRAKGIRE